MQPVATTTAKEAISRQPISSSGTRKPLVRSQLINDQQASCAAAKQSENHRTELSDRRPASKYLVAANMIDRNLCVVVVFVVGKQAGGRAAASSLIFCAAAAAALLVTL